jgi:small subunit ribosomal protein S2
LTRIPAAIFIVDVLKEHIALAEAKKLGIPVFAIVDTNSDPRDVDFVIPANDDATKSIVAIVDAVVGAVAEGLNERKSEKTTSAAESAATEDASDDAATDEGAADDADDNAAEA